MNSADINALIAVFAPEIRAYVAESLENHEKQVLEVVEKRLLAVPAVDISAVAQKAAALVPVPTNGEPGQKGDPGDSVTIDQVRPLVDEAVIKAISAIPMPKNGEKGDPGEPGSSVSQDDVQRMIVEAVSKAVESIDRPADGKNGRDALELDILPRIEPEKSYPRGMYARHEGGLWRSFMSTDGMKGWECIVAGIASFDIEQVDDRNVVAVIRQCDGQEVRRTLSIPAMIYRNVWREGTYFKGDTVTFGGSLWHCNVETASKPGDGNPDWTLAAKKGRDGKA